MSITVKSFGNLSDGREAVLYTITNETGASVSLTNYGAAVVSLNVPDKDGKLVDVVLGCDNAADQEAQTASLGAVPGRVANRIAKGIFELNGQTYHLYVNNGPNHLHGGKEGFDRKLWNHSVQEDKVVFSRLSPDGEEGYPGNLLVKVSYSLDEDNQLLIEFHALSDQDTVLNLCNHAYFNLSGHDSGVIFDQELKIYSEQFCECDSDCLTTGKVLPVEGTPMDFRQWKAIGKDIHEDNQHLKNGGGYDHNFVLKQDGDFALCAEAWSPKTDIHMMVYTTQPGIQLYTSNCLQDGNVTPKGGATYSRNHAFCLETQHWPNASSYEHFPSIVLRAGELYEHVCAYAFSVGK
ncbi:MAG: galactose mutarotase [Oscillospiraceae bacterium]|nr:galactose mutarotase [Oscillospiraceae bacterium]